MTTLLPPNSTALETAVDLAAAKSIESIPEKIIYDQWHPQFCPVHLLGFLAWALSVDDWSPDWPEDTKRAVIAASLEVHQHKGTLASVHRVLTALSVSTDIYEYPETPVPHTIEVIAYANRPLGGSNVLLDKATIRTVQRNLEAVKPARTTVSLKIGAPFSSKIKAAVMARVESIERIDSALKTAPQMMTQNLKAACFSRVVPMLRISGEVA